MSDLARVLLAFIAAPATGALTWTAHLVWGAWPAAGVCLFSAVTFALALIPGRQRS